MGLLDGLEKLITEHGSAAILKERIALANEKYTALEKRAAELDAENLRLKAETDVSNQKIKQLEAQIAAGGLADSCPSCRKRTYELIDSKPDPIFGDLGASRRTYKCSACGFSESKIADNQ